MTSIYLPKSISNKYDLGSKIFKYVKGQKQWYTIEAISFYGYRSKETHIKFKCKKIRS